jgi:hypothetical protein
MGVSQTFSERTLSENTQAIGQTSTLEEKPGTDDATAHLQIMLESFHSNIPLLASCLL